MWGEVGLSGPHQEPRWEASGKSSPSRPFLVELSHWGLQRQDSAAGDFGMCFTVTLLVTLAVAWLPHVPAPCLPAKAVPSLHPSCE